MLFDRVFVPAVHAIRAPPKGAQLRHDQVHLLPRLCQHVLLQSWPMRREQLPGSVLVLRSVVLPVLVHQCHSYVRDGLQELAERSVRSSYDSLQQLLANFVVHLQHLSHLHCRVASIGSIGALHC